MRKRIEFKKDRMYENRKKEIKIEKLKRMKKYL